MKLYMIVCLAIISVSAACESPYSLDKPADYKAEVRSNTSWSGVFATINTLGSGNKTIDLPDVSQCVEVKKATKEGFLRVRIIVEGGLFFWNNTEWEETTEEFGEIRVCISP